jgi:hypothetical protein
MSEPLLTGAANKNFKPNTYFRGPKEGQPKKGGPDRMPHDVFSPERKIQFLPLSAGQIGVRLIHILSLCLFSNQLFT